MPRAFLSHSSQDKGIVEVIANRFAKEFIVYDAQTFEEGGLNLEEILNNLTESDLFVLFISNAALESEWVKKEIIEAHNLHKNGKLKIIYPIIVDKEINFDDSRLPHWLKEYNLRYISKPSKIAQRILQKLKLVSWELYPLNKEKEQLFIGRHNLKKTFHERIFNFDLPVPLVCIASGFENVGRRKFFLSALKDANNIKDYYKPLYILLHSRSSIEDFILSIFDLGYTDSFTRSKLVDFLKKPLSEKIEIAKVLLVDIYETNNKVFVIDNYAIVNSDGTIVDWFNSLIKSLQNTINSTFLFLVSLSKVSFRALKNNDYVYSISISELDKPERNSLFQALLDIDKLSILKEDKKIISELFTGFPSQIKFAVDYIKIEGLQKLLVNLNELVDYNSEIIAKVIQNYDDNQKALVLLKLLADYEYISVSFLDKIYSGLEKEEKELMQEFSNKLVIEYFGASGEYIKLNDGIRDYIRRTGIKIPDNLRLNLRKITEEDLQNYTYFDDDISEFNITIQEAFIQGMHIPETYLIPSHFLLAMRELYDNHKKYNDVIELADRALNSYSHLDKKIKIEIQKWLCLALARKRDSRLLDEVQKIDGPEHNFLLGFYYRLNKNFHKAIERLNILIKEYPNFNRAKRELVQVYMNIEDFDAAYSLAKDNYENDKNNPYHIQSYLRCIYRKKDDLGKTSEIIAKLLTQLKSNRNEKAKEMFYTSKAQYETFYMGDKTAAFNTINEAIGLFPSNMYPYLIKLEISRKFFDVYNLGSTISLIENKFKDHDIYFRLSFISAKIVFLALEGKHFEAVKLIDDKIVPYYPSGTAKKLRDEIREINN